MARRIELDNQLRGILTEIGQTKPHVYYQPPETIKMEYPCIVYELASGKNDYADDRTYLYHDKYIATVIDKNPDSDIRDMMNRLKWCNFDRAFTSANLHHFVFTIYV